MSEDKNKCSNLMTHNFPNMNITTRCKWCSKTVGQIKFEKLKEKAFLKERIMPVEIEHKDEEGKVTIIKHDYRIVDNRKLNTLIILFVILIILNILGFLYMRHLFVIRGWCI